MQNFSNCPHTYRGQQHSLVAILNLGPQAVLPYSSRVDFGCGSPNLLVVKLSDFVFEGEPNPIAAFGEHKLMQGVPTCQVYIQARRFIPLYLSHSTVHFAAEQHLRGNLIRH